MAISRIRCLFLTGLGVLCLAGCAGTPSGVKTGVPMVDPHAAMARQMAQQFHGTRPTRLQSLDASTFNALPARIPASQASKLLVSSPGGTFHTQDLGNWWYYGFGGDYYPYYYSDNYYYPLSYYSYPYYNFYYYRENSDDQYVPYYDSYFWW